MDAVSEQIAILQDIIANCQDRIDRLTANTSKIAPEVVILAERRDRCQRALEEMRDAR